MGPDAISELKYAKCQCLMCSKSYIKVSYLILTDSVTQFSSVAQSCPTLCDRMDCSMPSSPVLHYFLECSNSMSIKSVMLSNHLILCRPLLLLHSVFPSIRSFQMSQLFTSGGQSVGVSASTSVLPMNIQDWFPLGWTGWISLQSKGLSRKIINSSVLSFLHSPTLTSIRDHWKTHSLDYMDLFTK